MKTWIAGATPCALAACGKADQAPDLSKLPPDEACHVMAKRAWEYKDAMLDTALGLLRKQGGTDEDLGAMRRLMSQPLECEGSALAGLADATRCLRRLREAGRVLLTMAYGPDGERLRPTVR